MVDADIDPSVLSALHIKNNEGFYNLVVSETVFGMRGIDYRSLNLKLTLIIANSFSNMRDAV